MPGPVPKPPATRQRRNRPAGAATLSLAGRAGPVPELPPRGGRRTWSPRTAEWWDRTWRSPMATEYLDADFDDLVMLAELRDDWVKMRDPMKKAKLMQEIRMQGARFGQSPKDRRALQWEIEKGEEAVERTNQRAARRQVVQRTAGTDPREALRAVK